MVSKLTVRTKEGDIIDVSAFKVSLKPCEGHEGGVGYEVFSYLVNDNGEENFRCGVFGEEEFEAFIGEVKALGVIVQEVIRECE
jgi:hypothetical protein